MLTLVCQSVPGLIFSWVNAYGNWGGVGFSSALQI